MTVPTTTKGSKHRRSAGRDLLIALQGSTGVERAAYRRDLEALGGKRVDVLVEGLESSDDLVRWECVNMLGELADPATAATVLDFALAEDEVHARWRAFWAVTRFEPQAIVPRLRRALRSKRWPRRWRAALILSMLGREEAADTVLEGLASDDEWTQWEALGAVRSLRLSGAEEPVSRFLGAQHARPLRQEAVLALGAIPSDNALDLLRRALRDAEPEVRWRASLALARHGGPKALAALHRQLAREADEKVARQIESDIRSLERERGRGPAEAK
jgi:HEAT repeat protein